MDLIIGQIRQNTNDILSQGDPITSLTHLMDIITPSTNNIKEYGEVFTPLELVNEILDKLPVHVWTNKDLKWLEPSSGIGNFMVCVYDRLMKGLKDSIPDKHQRKQHILKEMLWMVELNPKNVRMSRLIFGSGINIVGGNFLTWEPNMKFDVIIGNPPFQESSKSGDNKLYTVFIKKSMTLLHINGLLSLITPTKALDYLLITDKNRKIFDKLHNIIYICLNTIDKYFNVNSTFMYFLLTNNTYIGPTNIMYVNKDNMFNSQSIYLSKGFHLPKSLDTIDLNILCKITDDTNIFKFNEFKFGNKTQRIRKYHIDRNIVSQYKTDIHKYKIIDTINKTNKDGIYYYYDKLDNDIHQNKIIFSKKGYLMPTYDNSGSQSYSDNFKYICVDNESLLSLFISPIVNYLIFQYSKNGFDRIDAIRYLKKIKGGNIQNIYYQYNLTPEEVEYINKFNK